MLKATYIIYFKDTSYVQGSFFTNELTTGEVINQYNTSARESLKRAIRIPENWNNTILSFFFSSLILNVFWGQKNK